MTGLFIAQGVSHLREEVFHGAGRVVVKKAGHERLEDTPTLPPAGGRERTHGGAVIAAVARDDLVLPGMAGLLPVLARDLHRGFGGLGAAGEQLHAWAG